MTAIENLRNSYIAYKEQKGKEPQLIELGGLTRMKLLSEIKSGDEGFTGTATRFTGLFYNNVPVKLNPLLLDDTIKLSP